MTRASRKGRLNRRQLLRSGLGAAGGLIAAGSLAGCGEGQVREISPEMAERLASLKSGGNLREPGRFFTLSEFRLLERVSDLIIPDTDTPGALAAGVPQTLDRMLVVWALPETQKQWRDGIAAIDRHARGEAGEAFLDLDEDTQFALLEGYDRQAMENNDRDYRRMKSMIVGAYYTSEVGATQELLYDPVPGAYRGCVDFAEIGRTWAL